MNFSTSLYPQPNLSWQLLESNQMVTLVCTDIKVPKYSHGHSLCSHIFTMYVSFYLGAIYPLVTRARHLAHAQLSAMINPTRVQSIVIRCIIFISWNYCTDLMGKTRLGRGFFPRVLPHFDYQMGWGRGTHGRRREGQSQKTFCILSCFLGTSLLYVLLLRLFVCCTSYVHCPELMML